MMEKGRETKDATKAKTQETAQSAGDKASEMKGRAREGTEQTGSYLGDKTEAAKQKACDTAQSARDTAQVGKEKTGSFFQSVRSLNLMRSRSFCIGEIYVTSSFFFGRQESR